MSWNVRQLGLPTLRTNFCWSWPRSTIGRFQTLQNFRAWVSNFDLVLKFAVGLHVSWIIQIYFAVATAETFGTCVSGGYGNTKTLIHDCGMPIPVFGISYMTFRGFYILAYLSRFQDLWGLYRTSNVIISYFFILITNNSSIYTTFINQWVKVNIHCVALRLASARLLLVRLLASQYFAIRIVSHPLLLLKVG